MWAGDKRGKGKEEETGVKRGQGEETEGGNRERRQGGDRGGRQQLLPVLWPWPDSSLRGRQGAFLTRRLRGSEKGNIWDG